MVKSIEKESLSLIKAVTKFNNPNISIILKWEKDFTNFRIKGLQPKQRGKALSMSYKRKKKQINQSLNMSKELLNENQRLRCENELLKKLQVLIQVAEIPSHNRFKA